jgi:hypothetical protein
MATGQVSKRVSPIAQVSWDLVTEPAHNWPQQVTGQPDLRLGKRFLLMTSQRSLYKRYRAFCTGELEPFCSYSTKESNNHLFLNMLPWEFSSFRKTRASSFRYTQMCAQRYTQSSRPHWEEIKTGKNLVKGMTEEVYDCPLEDYTMEQYTCTCDASRQGTRATWLTLESVRTLAMATWQGTFTFYFLQCHLNCFF